MAYDPNAAGKLLSGSSCGRAAIAWTRDGVTRRSLGAAPARAVALARPASVPDQWAAALVSTSTAGAVVFAGPSSGGS
jgi:hypothetical protein